MSLATTLLLGALALTLAFTFAGVGFTHLNLSTRRANADKARNAAEAVIAQAIERVLSNNGNYFKAPPYQLLIQLQGAEGLLTFDPDEADDLDIAVSTYNLGETTEKTGAGGRMVPKDSIHFVGVGRANGVERRMEAILQVPTYPYALSTKGSLFSQGELWVAAAESPDDVVAGGIEANFDNLLPSHIAANSTDPDHAINLPSSSKKIRISGDARAAGGIEASSPFVQILGETRPDAGTIDMPAFEMRDFDPDNFGDVLGLPASLPADRRLAVGGLVKYNGDVGTNPSSSGPDGLVNELVLPTDGSGAIVWIDGDLEVQDGIVGQGAIFVTGNITIHGAGHSDVTAPNEAALIAGGDIHIDGDSQHTAFFKGLLVSGGEMSLQGVSVFGTVVVGATQLNGNPTGPADPSLSLEDATVVNVPGEVEFPFEIPFDMGMGTGFTTAMRPGIELERFLDNSPGPADERPFNPNLFTGDGFSAASPFGFKVGPNFVTKAGLVAQMSGFAGPIDWPPHGTEYANWTDAAVALGYPDLAAFIDGEMVPWIINHQRSIMREINTNYQADWPKEQGAFSLDPNQFLQLETKTRVVLWRDL